MPKRPRSGAGLGQILREEETKTACPACKCGKIFCATCKGSGFQTLEPLGQSRYRAVQCEFCQGTRYKNCLYCRGTGMVTASQASQWRMRAVKG